ncbi:MAG TPA: peptide chain release factor-like protein [Dissulfurispiraceae bacterium]
MKTFSLSLLKEQALRGRMEELNIREEDMEESFIRSGGKGGQHVNKVSTGVYLKHLPTGIEVKCGQERSQALNRYYARVILLEKIERMRKGKESEERQKREKLRRQRRGRPAKAKETMLAEKRRMSEKKRLRSSRFEL